MCMSINIALGATYAFLDIEAQVKMLRDMNRQTDIINT